MARSQEAGVGGMLSFQLHVEGDLLDALLLADELARTLAAAALSCFGNTALEGPGIPPGPATPDPVRRAVAFIESNLDRPLRLTEIADAARVGTRVLNKTFNRYLGTSPSHYVHRTRLDQAHRDLKAAEPGDGQTVGRVAARWGFGDPARFSAATARPTADHQPHPPPPGLRARSRLAARAVGVTVRS